MSRPTKNRTLIPLEIFSKTYAHKLIRILNHDTKLMIHKLYMFLNYEENVLHYLCNVLSLFATYISFKEVKSFKMKPCIIYLHRVCMHPFISAIKKVMTNEDEQIKKTMFFLFLSVPMYLPR
jgi:hypothetical protein